jgi:hypothetical protein
MKALGAVPVLLPMPDTYQSLDKGVIDGMTAPFEAALSFKLLEVSKYMAVGPWSFFHFTYSMNKAKWDSLPKDIQEVLLTLKEEYAPHFLDMANADAVKDKAEVLWVGGEGGMETALIQRVNVPFKAIPAAGLHGSDCVRFPVISGGYCADLLQPFASSGN